MRGWYQPIPQESDGSLLSRTTGLRLKREGQRLRMVDVLTGEPILWREELEAKVAEEAAGRQAAEARVVELEERLRNLEKERRQRPEP